ncbi:MAG: hypothetical protein ISEC1_P0807 [Thiomicrorhabdus sp.]|nr:MAG: hypothetical protein ISEC1_P0807 [Thiomicrorhabdus sp.]
MKVRQNSSLLSLKEPRQSIKTSLLSLALLGCMPSSSMADEVLQTEKKLVAGLESIQSLSIDQALLQFSELSEQYPNYKLVQLLKADILAIKAGNKSLSDDIHRRNPRTVGRLKSEALVRWEYSKSIPQHNIEFENHVLKTAQQKHLVFIDLSDNRLYFYERNSEGVLELKANYYVSMGRLGSGKQKEGDSKTPVGIYHIVDLLPDSEVSDLYGIGALPLNYPNKWDLEHGKTGSGIWLHGTPRNTYIRAPKASRGCIVLNNSAMETLLAEYQLPFSTPVLIVDDVDKISLSVKKNPLVLSEVKTWLENNHIGVDWGSVSVYRYPNEAGLLYVTFPAELEAELIHQYWQQGVDGDWRLVYQSQEVILVKKPT